jgi:hypothetical protein
MGFSTLDPFAIPMLPGGATTVLPDEPCDSAEKPGRAPHFIRDPAKGDRPGQSPEHIIPQPFRIDY